LPKDRKTQSVPEKGDKKNGKRKGFLKLKLHGRKKGIEKSGGDRVTEGRKKREREKGKWGFPIDSEKRGLCVGKGSRFNKKTKTGGGWGNVIGEGRSVVMGGEETWGKMHSEQTKSVNVRRTT